jgi:hypothetical protein
MGRTKAVPKRVGQGKAPRSALMHGKTGGGKWGPPVSKHPGGSTRPTNTPLGAGVMKPRRLRPGTKALREIRK